ncbi:hypothetical protein WJX72_002057 [[Myrmecia] bisecta]|uniref:Uncharacterized protein n=1 Tax=[Myrmecia] bisecta TaxID=41462 RepID=A0AAW1R659_9CHLO
MAACKPCQQFVRQLHLLREAGWNPNSPHARLVLDKPPDVAFGTEPLLLYRSMFARMPCEQHPYMYPAVDDAKAGSGQPSWKLHSKKYTVPEEEALEEAALPSELPCVDCPAVPAADLKPPDPDPGSEPMHKYTLEEDMQRKAEELARSGSINPSEGVHAHYELYGEFVRTTTADGTVLEYRFRPPQLIAYPNTYATDPDLDPVKALVHAKVEDDPLTLVPKPVWPYVDEMPNDPGYPPEPPPRPAHQAHPMPGPWEPSLVPTPPDPKSASTQPSVDMLSPNTANWPAAESPMTEHDAPAPPYWNVDADVWSDVDEVLDVAAAAEVAQLEEVVVREDPFWGTPVVVDRGPPKTEPQFSEPAHTTLDVADVQELNIYTQHVRRVDEVHDTAELFATNPAAERNSDGKPLYRSVELDLGP